MQHMNLLKKSALALFMAAALYSCKSDDEDSSPIPIDPEPEPKTAVHIPDQNFEQRLIALGIDTDREVNQQIWLEDALAATVLELFSTDEQDKITDLTGIEEFTNLRFLSVSNNDLQSIDLSKNKALERLNLDYNEFSNIDLSENSELTVLTMVGNDLEAIDLSANHKLETLNLTNNLLQSLDVSANTELINLNMTVNALKSIVGLENVQKLKELRLGFNYLEELALNLPALIGINVEQNDLKVLNLQGANSLEYLLATNNQLTVLDVSESPTLKHLKVSYNQISELGLSNNTDLEILWASGNQLSELDVSGLSALYDLRVIRNDNLTCIEIAEGQEIATLHTESYQGLSAGGCN